MLLAPFTSRCTRAPQPRHRKRRPRGEFLTERLHALAVQGILPTFRRLLQLAGAEPPPLDAGLRVQPDQVRPQASRLGAQRLALQPCGRGETLQGDEAHDARRPRVLGGRRPPSFPPPQENTGYSLEQMFVKPGGAIHPSTEAEGFLAFFL